MQQTTRRTFMRQSGKTLAGVAAGAFGLGFAAPGRVRGANERVNIGWIGCGGRGRLVARGLIEQGGEIVYACDLHEGRLAECTSEVEQIQNKKPRTTKDMHELFASKDIDAVLVTTPDHWHAPITIMACQAGKDVFVEKPHAHNIWESRMMVRAARKYNRIVQVGTQNRSAPYNMAALEYIKSGKLGKIGLVKVFNLKSGDAFKLGDPGTAPDGFDWDKWLGAAHLRPYHKTIFGYGWHHFWDFSGGDMTDDGIHQLDLALMLMGDPGVPKTASCIAGRFVYRGDDSQVPDVAEASFEFDDFILTMEHSNYPRYMQKTTATIRRNDLFPYWTQNATRIEIYGSETMMTIGRHGGGWQVMTSGGKVVDQMYGRFPDDVHQKNFIDCVKSRNRPNADIETIHPSFCTLHFANIAHRVGNMALKYDRSAEKFIDNDAANGLIKRVYRDKYEIPETI